MASLRIIPFDTMLRSGVKEVKKAARIDYLPIEQPLFSFTTSRPPYYAPPYTPLDISPLILLRLCNLDF
jgi:hypothetical protein